MSAHTIRRSVEIGLPEGALEIGFAPAAPDGTPSPIVTVRNQNGNLLGTVTPQEALMQAYEILACERGKGVPAKLVRGLACFVIAHIRLRLAAGTSPAGGGAAAAGPASAAAAEPAAAPAMPPPPVSHCRECGE